MREDVWLGERLGRQAWTVDDADHAGDLHSKSGGFFQAKVPTDDVARVVQLQDAGFRTVDVNVLVGRDPGHLRSDDAVGVRDARSDDHAAVSEMVARDYRVSRFHLDPAIALEVAITIKRDWIANFFAGDRGDRLLVAQRSGELAGFLLTLESASASTVDLIAVAASARGCGIGRALVARLADERPDVPILAGTQISNVGALRFYERLGFPVRETKFVLHRHA